MFVIITEEILLVILLDFYNRIHINLPIGFDADNTLVYFAIKIA